MNPLLIKYGLIAFIYVGSVVGGAWWYGRVVNTRWEAATEKLKTEAANIQLESERASRQKDAENAEASRNADAIYQNMLADAYSSRDGFAQRVRNARRGTCSSDILPRPPSVAGVSKDATGSGELGLGQSSTVDPLVQARDGVKALIASLSACHSWAIQVGAP